MKNYKNILYKILEYGENTPNRTGIDTRSIFGTLFEHDMRDGFPLLTTKKINPKTIFIELEGFIKGITNKKWYQLRGCYIWDEWSNPQSLKAYNWDDLSSVVKQLVRNQSKSPSLSPKFKPILDDLLTKVEELDLKCNSPFAPSFNSELESIRDDIRKAVQFYEPDLGPIYGYQWRYFGRQYSPSENNDGSFTINGYKGVDQLAKLINTLKNNPLDRRMIVSAWNPIELENDNVALPACHFGYQVNSNGKEFDLMWSQRSVDVGAGLPFNIGSYAMLMVLIGKETGLTPRYLKGCLGNTHIYMNHLEQMDLQLSREERTLPTIVIPDTGKTFPITDKAFSIYDWEYDQYEISGYDPHPFIKLPIAV